MTTILVIAIYIMTIGLGLPDSTLGSAWPSVYVDLNLPVGYASFISFLISGFTVVASLFSARMIKKLGMGGITTISSILAGIGLIGFSFSNSIFALCLFAIPCGLGAGSIDAAINDYLSVNYSSFQMNLNHCFYGIGVALSPYLISLALANGSWRMGYRLVFFVQLIVIAVAFLALPLWKKAKEKNAKRPAVTPIILSYKQMFKTKGVPMGWVTFLSTCALEFTCGTWACTYLVSEGLSNEVGAKLLVLYYIGMASGRFFSGLLTTKISNKKTIAVGYCVVGVAVIIFTLPLPATIKGLSLFLIGFGNGPTFPNLVYLTPKIYGEERSSSIISSWLVMCNLGIMIAPQIFGFLAQRLGLGLFPTVIAILFIMMVLFTIIYFAKVKNFNKSIDQTDKMPDNI